MLIRIFNFTIIFLLISLQSVFADNVRISQIDSSSLLLDQSIDLYVSITNDSGLPIKNLDAEDFSIFESPENKKYIKIPEILNFQTMANYESGITFLLLIDNSGSMYRNMEGRRTKSEEDRRISHAKKAVSNFLNSITNPKDRIGLGSYNSYYTSHTEPINDKQKIKEYFDDIQKPSGNEGYSEIYSSIYLAIDEFRMVKGRKAIIVLSDGENRPYYPYVKKEHEVLGTKVFKYIEPLKYCLEEGVSVFSIYFGKKGGRKDRKLNKIAIETGGSVFDAHNAEELSEVYSRIITQILNEYRLTYSATMDPADRKYVKVKCDLKDSRVASERFYFSSTVFGLPSEKLNAGLIFFFFLPFLFMWLLSLIKFEKKKSDAYIQVLNPGGAKSYTKMFTLEKGKTVIGGSQKADMTIISGVTQIEEKHAVITFDEKKKKYTIIGEGKFKVNNKPATTRVLESGDVINIDGTTIVFDDGEVE